MSYEITDEQLDLFALYLVHRHAKLEGGSLDILQRLHAAINGLSRATVESLEELGMIQIHYESPTNAIVLFSDHAKKELIKVRASMGAAISEATIE